ncbi:2795_t:CDS:2 [Funneliformis mosseae]|uniref:2795_t:CDS:1 n=1 Tax=Funneliformis mosseae TaxID=27381 RepID=A0A9N9D838_FUNMO|nr:2795_t:CDS:2 [Funneliformis mosseae]
MKLDESDLNKIPISQNFTNLQTELMMSVLQNCTNCASFVK